MSAASPSSGEVPEYLPAQPGVLDVLVENHRRFLAFLERRVESREAAEDILQDAFVRGLKGANTVRQRQAVIPWFYRLLRNALVDHYRKRDAEGRALDRAAAGEAGAVEPGPDQELEAEVCACVTALVETLKPEYRQAVRRVDLEGATLAAFAREEGITSNNAGVRLHRAHAALKRQLERSCGTCARHGCLDCDCGGR